MRNCMHIAGIEGGGGGRGGWEGFEVMRFCSIFGAVFRTFLF